ncbi:MAG: PEP-CTERM sorting domain-containing protein [bacterium]|nr:PEP-CTERM sorting domain-containing protein [bacterium]
MKKILLLVVAVALVFGLSAVQNVHALDFGQEITIPDENSKDQNWHRKNEDQEVEPGMQHGQKWDLEGFFLNGDTLSIVGGYNFKDGQSGWMPGDIFIDVTGDAVFGDIHGTEGNGHNDVPNTFGYDYVIDLKSDFAYDVYKIDDTSTVTTAFYAANQGSSPWQYVSGGTEVLDENGVAAYKTYDEDILGFEGGYHNVITALDLSFLDGKGFTVHYTMGCGNDNLMGEFKPVPEPSTLLLLGLGLLGIVGVTRKGLKK